MTNKYVYGNKISEVHDASNVTGVLMKLNSGEFAFRNYRGQNKVKSNSAIRTHSLIISETIQKAQKYKYTHRN
jgi:hypothetical protein